MKLNIKKYNFSEVQSGKDLCDPRTGTCRLHILNYVNEGHNVTNAMEMKEALENHGGIRNTYVNVISMNKTPQPALKGRLKILISQYNNFNFEDDGLRIFKAYGIDGEKISKNEMERISKNMSQKAEVEVLEPSKEHGTKKSSFRTQKQQTLYCLEPDCMKQFTKESRLLRHLAIGQHLYDKEEDDTTVDKTK